MQLLRRKFARKAQPIPQEPSYFERFANALNGKKVDLHASTPSPLFPFGNVTIIGELNLPQCKKYGVLQKLEVLNELGIESNYSYWEDIPRSLDLLQMASVGIIYRLPANETFWSYLKEATRLGISVGYDIDDPIFHSELYNRNSNLDFLAPEEKLRLVSDSDGHLRAMRACDFLITSTPGMVALAERSYKGPIYLWRFAIDHETRNAAAHAISMRATKSQDVVTIAYLSGSRAHEADFREVETALATTMKNDKRVRLLVVGYLNLPDALQPFADRIDIQSFCSFDTCLARLAATDINIVPLVNDPFNECKSAIRYLEASILAIPTIASAVGDYANVIVDKSHGLLAQDESEWEAHLVSLIESKDRREAIGATARDMVLARYTSAAIARGLPQSLLAALKSVG